MTKTMIVAAVLAAFAAACADQPPAPASCGYCGQRTTEDHMVQWQEGNSWYYACERCKADVEAQPSHLQREDRLEQARNFRCEDCGRMMSIQSKVDLDAPSCCGESMAPQ